MAEQQRRGTYVGLACASALVVLIASGVAVRRIGSDDRSGRPSETAAPAPAHAPESQSGAAAAGGQRDGASSAGAAGIAPESPQPAPVPPPVPARSSEQLRRTGRAAYAAGHGEAPSADGPESTTGIRSRPGTASDGTGGAPPGDLATPGTGSGDSGRSGESGGSDPGGGAPPDAEPLLTASVSVGEGAGGAVVGAGVGESTPDVDVTVGDSPVIGDAPPSSGTGIDLGGRFLHPSLDLEPT